MQCKANTLPVESAIDVCTNNGEGPILGIPNITEIIIDTPKNGDTIFDLKNASSFFWDAKVLRNEYGWWNFDILVEVRKPSYN